MRLQRLQSVARILTTVAAAASAAFVLTAAVAIGEFALAVAVLAGLVVRLQAPTERWRDAGAIGLVLAVAAIIGVDGGPSSSLFALLLLVLADFGIARPTRTVVAVGAVAAGVSAAAAVVAMGTGVASPAWVWTVLLVPLVGVVAGFIGDREAMEGTAALESATAALDEVLALAERLPSGFDRWSVASAVHLEARESAEFDDRDGDLPHLLLVQDGVLFGVGAPIARRAVGLLSELPPQRRRRVWTTVELATLPEALQAAFEAERWYLHRLGGHGDHGVLLVPADITPAALEEVGAVLRPAAIALGNVDRFERLADIAMSAARTRVAHDLHDGVAQALTHVRFELDLLGLEHDELADEVDRIRSVADAALLDVRRTVGELRDVTPLAERIEAHVELLSSFVPAEISLEQPEVYDLDARAADEVFRIVQEALSNAVRHAAADTIRVTLIEDVDAVTLAVHDDGVGMAVRPRRGVGLDAMSARAARLGGRLVVRPRTGGGTVVELEIPLESADGAGVPTGAPDVPARSGR